jgi:hypothetical protein
LATVVLDSARGGASQPVELSVNLPRSRKAGGDSDGQAELSQK